MLQDPTSRRCFLKVVARGSALAGAAGLGVACSDEPTGSIAAGNVSALAVGALNVVPGSALAIGRDADGLYAMTLICTHAQCDIAADGSVTAQLITCNCHGSEFDANGAVVRGPAQTPLEHFEVTVDGTGAITVDASQTVSAEVRTAVT